MKTPKKIKQHENDDQSKVNFHGETKNNTGKVGCGGIIQKHTELLRLSSWKT